MPAEGGLVVAGDGGFSLVAETGEEGLGEGDIVSSWFC